MMNAIKRLFALVLAAALLAGSAGAESFLDWIFEKPEQTTPEPLWDTTLAPEVTFPDCALEDDGLLRVLLRSMSTPGEMHLTLLGKYAVEGDRGFRFERGTELTLYIEDGELWMTDGRMTIDMGLSMTLTRHAAMDGEDGMLIRESEKPNLYLGDLSVQVTPSGLRPVLTIQMEDYLKGVVAYEMSDSFPMEALKAQAVAARTYALQRKRREDKRDYDVSDTTADQVFKGWDPEYENVIAAVDATRGLVGIYDGAPATCYYTASNGGQTALPGQLWGLTENDAYLSMRDDPYDLENPRSMVSDLTFTAECGGSLKLKQMLTDALSEVMAKEGYADDAWAFDAIAAIEPVNPRFEGSRMFDGLAFDLRVRVAESALPAASAAPEASQSPETDAPDAGAQDMSLAPISEKWVLLPDTRRVVLDVYDDIKDGLSMGLNESDCELISVETEGAGDIPAAFRLIMRRFGHGVGMSQRGAQWMAGQYGMSFTDILSFYYPGMAVERMAWPESTLTSLLESEAAVGAARPKPSPTPSPAPLPAPGSDERIATVAVEMLNLRQQPTTTSRILDVLEAGMKVVAAVESDENGWVAVRTGEQEGYVKAEYLGE